MLDEPTVDVPAFSFNLVSITGWGKLRL